MAKWEGTNNSLIEDLQYYINFVKRLDRGDHRAYTDDEADALFALYNSPNLKAFGAELVQLLKDHPALARTYNANAPKE